MIKKEDIKCPNCEDKFLQDHIDSLPGGEEHFRCKRCGHDYTIPTGQAMEGGNEMDPLETMEEDKYPVFTCPECEFNLVGDESDATAPGKYTCPQCSSEMQLEGYTDWTGYMNWQEDPHTAPRVVEMSKIPVKKTSDKKTAENVSILETQFERIMKTIQQIPDGMANTAQKAFNKVIRMFNPDANEKQELLDRIKQKGFQVSPVYADMDKEDQTQEMVQLVGKNALQHILRLVNEGVSGSDIVDTIMDIYPGTDEFAIRSVLVELEANVYASKNTSKETNYEFDEQGRTKKVVEIWKEESKKTDVSTSDKKAWDERGKGQHLRELKIERDTCYCPVCQQEYRKKPDGTCIRDNCLFDGTELKACRVVLKKAETMAIDKLTDVMEHVIHDEKVNPVPESKPKEEPKGGPPYQVLRYKCPACGKTFENDFGSGDKVETNMICPRCDYPMKEEDIVHKYVESSRSFRKLSDEDISKQVSKKTAAHKYFYILIDRETGKYKERGIVFADDEDDAKVTVMKEKKLPSIDDVMVYGDVEDRNDAWTNHEASKKIAEEPVSEEPIEDKEEPKPEEDLPEGDIGGKPNIPGEETPEGPKMDTPPPEPPPPPEPDLLQKMTPMDTSQLTSLNKQRDQAIDRGDTEELHNIEKQVSNLVEKYTEPVTPESMSQEAFIGRKIQTGLGIRRDYIPLIEKASMAVTKVATIFNVSFGSISLSSVSTDEWKQEPEAGTVEFVVGIRPLSMNVPHRSAIIKINVGLNKAEVVPFIWDSIGRKYNLDEDGLKLFLGMGDYEDIKNLERDYLTEEKNIDKQLETGEIKPDVFGIGASKKATKNVKKTTYKYDEKGRVKEVKEVFDDEQGQSVEAPGAIASKKTSEEPMASKKRADMNDQIWDMVHEHNGEYSKQELINEVMSKGFLFFRNPNEFDNDKVQSALNGMLGQSLIEKEDKIWLISDDVSGLTAPGLDTKQTGREPIGLDDRGISQPVTNMGASKESAASLKKAQEGPLDTYKGFVPGDRVDIVGTGRQGYITELFTNGAMVKIVNSDSSPKIIDYSLLNHLTSNVLRYE